MSYELIGLPKIEDDYSDQWETTMVCDVRRNDGETGDVWIVAGVPDHLRGTSEAARTQSGYERVWMFGNSPEVWAASSLLVDCEDIPKMSREIIVVCKTAALEAHRMRLKHLD